MTLTAPQALYRGVGDIARGLVGDPADRMSSGQDHRGAHWAPRMERGGTARYLLRR